MYRDHQLHIDWKENWKKYEKKFEKNKLENKNLRKKNIFLSFLCQKFSWKVFYVGIIIYENYTYGSQGINIYIGIIRYNLYPMIPVGITPPPDPSVLYLYY